MRQVTTELIGNRYELMKQLGSGAMGVVYEAYDRLYQHKVALKQVIADFDNFGSTVGASSATELRLALANEFQVLSSIRHPHIMGVSDYGFHRGQPYYTMQFLESPQSFSDYAQGQPLEVQVRIIVQMLQALEYLHHRGIIHRDLKPDNALVSQDGDVYVLDFGLATLHESKTDDGSIVGTIAYMAPEILQGEGASPASDLYAVGTMAFEIFAGRSPFVPANVGQLIFDIIESAPDLGLMDVSPEIAQIIGRLLSKTPEERYDQAHDVIRDLDLVTKFKLPDESIAIRESYLQTATFVGREREFNLLTDAINAVMQNKGSAWLVAGESGVGKSRLIDEIRTYALVKGALVLNGQAIAEGGLSYQLWLNPLRRLALSLDLEDTYASVLKQILPEIGQLLGREIGDAPVLDGQAGQQRLIDTITDMFLKFEEPIVLFLEDLQWADESLDVVKALIAHLEDEPVMIVGSYGNDERASLADELSDMKLMMLDRLDDDQIANLSVSILGEAGRDKAIINLLNRETEGNVFFLVEVIRALAEKAGQLSNIQTMTLPTRVFADGINMIVERRLAQVPADSRILLETAAISGRQIDINVLRHIAKNVELDAWLTTCANAAVLEVIDEQWRFTHEKLREGIIHSLSSESFKQKHHLIADTLIEVYSESHKEYASLISDHYEQAEAVDKATQWHMIAGAHARETFAPATGLHHYRRATHYWHDNDDIAASEKLIQIYREMGVMLIWQAEFNDAADAFSKLLTLATASNNQESQARAYWGLAVTNFRTGHPRQAFDEAERGLALAQAINAFELASELLAVQGMCQYAMGDLQEGRIFATRALEMSEEENAEYAIAQSLNLRGVLDMNLGIFDEAEQDFNRALIIFENLGVRPSAMSVVNNLGLIAIFRGDYAKAVEQYRDAIRRSQEAGQIHLEMEFTSNLGEALVRIGDNTDAVQKLIWVIDQSKKHRFPQISETYRFLAEAYLSLGELTKATQAAQDALKFAYEVDYQEFIAGALNVLGQVLASFDKTSSLDLEGESREFNASTCFNDADSIFVELGMGGERARNLRAWAQYEIEKGDRELGHKMWKEALRLLESQGATSEVDRMNQVYPPS